MRFTESIPGLAKALENVGTSEGLVSALTSVAEHAPQTPTIVADDLVSLFTTADEAEDKRNKVEDENVSRFIRAPDDDEAPRRTRPRRDPPTLEPRREPTSKSKTTAAQATKPRTTNDTTTTNDGRSRQAPPNEAPPVAPRRHGRIRARPERPERGEQQPSERSAVPHDAERTSTETTTRVAHQRAARRENDLRRHLERTQQLALVTDDRRAARRADHRRADAKRDARQEAAQQDGQRREPRAEDTDRALRWKDAFDTDNPFAKGGHGWADFMVEREDTDEDRLGLVEADALNDGLRCKGRVEDGSRCLRRPPEGEMYCTEHRTTVPMIQSS